MRTMLPLYLLLLVLLPLLVPRSEALTSPSSSSSSLSSSRRAFLATATTTTTTTITSAAAAFLATALAFPQNAHAIPPLTEAELNRLEKPLWSINPPDDKKVSRPKLALDFAVLLTRSSYAEADQLDIIPINQLERDMYLVRTTEYLPYTKRAGSLMQGDLTDPKYFDYMSAVQYVVINRALQDPETVFDEMQPEDTTTVAGKLKTVRVQRTLPDEVLVPTHDERVGTSILDYMNDTYGNTPIALPKFAASTSSSSSPDKPGSAAVLQALSQLVNLFLINGFAWDGKAELVKETKDTNNNNKKKKFTFLLTLQAPATLWSSQVLAKQGAPLRNDFLLKTAKQLVRSMGYTVQSSSVSIKGDKELSLLTIE